MKTAIEQLIEDLEQQRSRLKKEMNLPPNLGNQKQTLIYLSEINGLDFSINKAKLYLPIEKQQIVDAAADQLSGIMFEDAAKQVGEEYYKTTFNK